MRTMTREVVRDRQVLPVMLSEEAIDALVNKYVRWDTELTKERLAYRRRLHATLQQATDLIGRATSFLRRTTIEVLLYDAIQRAGCKVIADISTRYPHIQEQFEELAGLDLSEAIGDLAMARPERFDATADVTGDLLSREIAPMDPWVGLATSIIASTELEQWRQLCEFAQQPKRFEEIENWLSRLQALVRRHDQHVDKRLLTLADAYRSGEIEIADIADALGQPIPDVVLLLEKHGIHRTPEQQILADEDRAAMLGKIAERRAARNGVRVQNKRLVTLDAIATQHLDKINARRCLNQAK